MGMVDWGEMGWTKQSWTHEDWVDIVLLSNGPGEVFTWVRPVVQALRSPVHPFPFPCRISLILSPCPHASGREGAIARSWPEIDRVQEPEFFFPFLLWGKTAEGWEWGHRGVVLFLGGDQLFPVMIGKRLGYGTVIYAEWETRWVPWVDRVAVRRPEGVRLIPARFREKVTVVGDLMVDAVCGLGSGQLPVESSDKSPVPLTPEVSLDPEAEWIGLLPGSKAIKLAQGVPFCVAIAEQLQLLRPQTRFMIPVAPTLSLGTLVRYADPQFNPILSRITGTSARLVHPEGSACPFLETQGGTRIELWTRTPAYDGLARCRLCITTVGANTAELGVLGVPMLVLLPMQQPDAMRAWGGLAGLLANLPGMGRFVATALNWQILRSQKLLAWPNIWAGEEIVPELKGLLDPGAIALQALDWLEHPEQLDAMRVRLEHLRGEAGAAHHLVRIIQGLLMD